MEKYVTVKIPLSVAKGLKDYRPISPSSDEVWMYKYPSGTLRHCITVSLPYADNGSCMIALSEMRENRMHFPGTPKPPMIKKTLPHPEVICITDAGEGLIKLGEKMERMAGEWSKVGKMSSYLQL